MWSANSIGVVAGVPLGLWLAERMGWASVTPQQYRLIEIKAGHEAILVALNSSAVSLGSVAGTASGGVALASGFRASKLPYATAAFVFCALVFQMVLVLKQDRAVTPRGEQGGITFLNPA